MPDKSPWLNEAVRIVVQTRSQLHLRLYNTCIGSGCFPARWKQQKLVLMSKGKKSTVDNSLLYRPLILLNTVGKLFERIVLVWLKQAYEDSWGLSTAQYGFRKALSMQHALQKVQSTVEKVLEDHTKLGSFCAIVALDVKNAFNSASWEQIYTAFKGKIPNDLERVVSNCLLDRKVVMDTTWRKGASCPQGSSLGPFFWNVMNDNLLRLALP